VSDAAEPSYLVDPRRCIRCGACATAAHGLFTLEGATADGPRHALTPDQRRACEAALLLCPTSAIRRVPEEHA
jgi:ferredoxin